MAKKTITTNGATWKGTSAKDKVYIDWADYVSVNTAGGNDSVYNDWGWHNTINTGAGNDTIILEVGYYSSINAGAGNDRISLTSNSVNVSVKYAAGDGSDVIYGFDDDDMLQITGGTYKRSTVGNDVVLTVGDGKITLKGAKNTKLNIIGTLEGGKKITNTNAKKKLTGTSYADTINNSGDKVTIVAGKGNDKIENKNGTRSSINAGAGNDYIHQISYDRKGHYVTILGGAGNDIINNEYGDYSKIDGGAGNDSIQNGSWFSTIIGGAGNDTITNLSETVTVDSGAGDDVVYNYKNARISLGAGNDTFHNWGGNVYVSAADGNDFISTSTGNKVTIDCGNGKDTVHNWSEQAFISGGTGNDDIMNGSNVKANNSTVDAGDGYDTVSNYSNYASIFGGTGNDVISNGGYYDANNSTLKGGAGNDSIYNNSGSNNSIFGGTGNDFISLSSAAKNNLIQYKSGDGSDIIYGYSEKDTIQITGAKYTKKISGDNIIITVGKGRISLMGAASLSSVNIDGTYKGKLNIPTDAYTYGGHSYQIYNNVANTWYEAKAYCEARGGHLAVINDAKENSALFNYMKSKDYMEAYFGLTDATKEGTWTWTTGDKVSYKNWASNEPNGGTYENYGMFYAWTYPNGEWNDGDFNGAKAFICEWDTVTTGGGSDTVEPTPTVQPAPTVSADNLIEGTSGHDKLSNYKSGKVIYGYGGNDTVYNYADNVYISGGDGNDSLRVYGDNSTIYGGTGNDIVTVKSNNAFVYGDDGHDTIKSYEGNTFIYGGKGDDYIYTEYNNNGSVDGGAGDDTIRAYQGTHLTLSGGAGNDSLWGSTGNDTLIGGSGDDIFIYKPGEGTDHITDFQSGDLLKILKTNGYEGGSFDSATFGSNTLTLAISGGGSVILDNVSAGSQVNINGTNYTISGNTLK